MRIARICIFVLSVALLPSTALAQADCSKEIAAIEERIQSGNYSERDVGRARQLQASFKQMCGFLDDATKAQFMEQIDQFLPAVLAEKPRVERQGNSDTQEAARDARRTKKAAARADVVLDPVLQAAPTAQSKGGQVIDRPDPMTHLQIWDWDTLGDKLRILYLTHPDRMQAGGPDWKNHIYVLEVSTDGTTIQHHVTSKQENFIFGGVALRRGHDEVIFNRRHENDGKAGTLERWSISGQRQISSVPTPKPMWPDGKNHDWGPFRVATSDGNVFFSQIKAAGRREPSTIAWFEASPDGRVLGKGSMTHPTDNYRIPAWFSSRNGGGGMVLDISARQEEGIDSALTTPIRYQIGGRQIHAVVGREKRLLVSNDNANSAWESAAVERGMRWGGDLAIPASVPAEENLRQTNEYRQLMGTVSNEHDANRRIGSKGVGPFRLEIVEPMKNGFGILSDVTANVDLVPPIHGHYFLSVDKGGTHKRAYLEPWAKQLGVKFTLLGISENDDVYLYGFPGNNNDSYVVRLDANGKPEAHGRVPNGRQKTMEGLAGDGKGVWLIGRHEQRGDNRAKLWVERVEFP